jgi:Tfp pilus assembly protein PilF
VYTGVSFVFLLTFIFTYSRGAWLQFPIVYLLFLFLLGDVYRILEGVLLSGVAGILTLCAIPLFYKYANTQNSAAIWQLTIGGALTAIVLSFVIGFVVEFLKKINRKTLLLGGGGLVTLTIALIVILLGVVLNTEKPIELSHRHNEKDSVKEIAKVIDGVQSNNEYIFKYDIQSSSQDEKKWAYKLIVDSINNKKETQNILETTNIDLQDSNEIVFKTLEDTEKLNVRIINQYAGTSVKLQNAVLVNQSNNQQERVIFRYKYIPDSIAARFNDINAETHSVTERIVFYKDALKMIKDRPIVGAGGGGWAALNFMYQSYMYWSTQTHNYIMQVWIETGTVGLLALLSFLGLLLINIYKIRKQKKVNNDDMVLAMTLAVAVISLVAHSIIDFDLSLAAISLMLWEVIACFVVISNDVLSHCERSEEYHFVKAQKIRKSAGYEYISVAVVSVVLLISVISLHSGYTNAQIAIQRVKENNLPYAIKFFEKAVERDPFTASYKMDLAGLYNKFATKEQNGKIIVENKEQFENTERLMQQALKLEPYSSQLYAHAASFAMSRGEIEKGLEYIEKSIKVQPLRIQNYQQKADVYFQIGINNLNAKKYDEAEKAFNEVLSIPKVVKGINKKLLKPISLNSETMEYIEKSIWLLDNYQKSDSVKKFSKLIYYAYMGCDFNEKGLPDLWSIWNPKGTTIKTEIINGEAIRITNLGKSEGIINTRKVTLHPDKKYLLEFKARGNVKKNTIFEVFVASDKGQYIQFHADSIMLEDDFKKYSFEFTTTKDITGGKQNIRFDHNGNDDGYIEIKEIYLYKINDN